MTPTDPRPAGCQTPLHVLERMLRDTDAWPVFLELTRGGPGAAPGSVRNPEGVNQWLKCDEMTLKPESPPTIPIVVARKPPTGTSTSYLLRQLERGRKVRGGDMPLIKRICADDPEAVDLLDRATQRPDGPPPKMAKTTVDNVNSNTEVRPSGNAAKQAIRRLREQRPDLHARVIAKELSPHKAMLEAGFRKPTIMLPVEPGAAARLIVKHFKGDALRGCPAFLHGGRRCVGGRNITPIIGRSTRGAGPVERPGCPGPGQAEAVGRGGDSGGLTSELTDSLSSNRDSSLITS